MRLQHVVLKRPYTISLYNFPIALGFIYYNFCSNYMTCQVIRNAIPKHILLVFLDLYATHTAYGHLFDRQSYKRAAMAGGVTRLNKYLIPFYHKSKSFYLTRKESFVNLSTVIRQLCRRLKIGYSSSIKYERSSYSITYRIHSRCSLAQT